MVEKILSYSQSSYLSCGFVKKYIKCTNVLAPVFLVHKIYKKTQGNVKLLLLE